MPSFCVVANCCDKYGHSESISFHKFPFKRKDLLQKWTEFTQREPDWKPTKWSAICSQHFTAEDFNCINARKTLKKTAVPTVRLDQKITVAGLEFRHKTLTKNPSDQTEEKLRKGSNRGIAGQFDFEYENNEGISTLKTSTISNAFKTCCRLCGVSACAAGTFSTNFEIFGMIQKCFPTLNIQQDDNLPKDMCHSCLKCLRNFSEFIDKVLETQSKLQKTYRIEKHAKSQEQRPLKIKQEPVSVKVKQEVSEGFDSFLSDDLDVGMDDCCEPEPDTDSVDQKFGFCDFPMINAQDIINNCDIMEIINLDDPFINIPDDDGATVGEQIGQKKVITPSARQLLETHLLIDEHNYACPADDLKEEWQIKKCCKTEELEGTVGPQSYQNRGENCLNNENSNFVAALESNDAVHKQIPKAFEANERSTKPIVTSVSAIAQSRNKDDNTSNGNSSKLVATSISDLLPETVLWKPENQPISSKPNIVVLNESIVKSAEAFQLHACSVCQLKFFSVESLQQHFQFSHAVSFDAPISNNASMVSFAMENITKTSENVNAFVNKDSMITPQNDIQKTVEQQNIDERPEMLNFDNNENEPTNTNILSNQLKSLQSWQYNMKTLQLNALINSWAHEPTATPSAANPSQANGILKENHEPANRNTAITSEDGHSLEESTSTESRLMTATATVAKERLMQSGDSILPASYRKINTKRLRNIKKKSKINYLKSGRMPTAQQTLKTPTLLPQRIATNYKFLQRRFRLLLRKCKALEENCQLLAGSSTNCQSTWHTCPHCRTRCKNIYQLLHHKQKHHRMQKIRNFFSASCFGCEKYFLSKRALVNHMKYICQSMSLRWFKTQLQTFKCRECRSISFTHWRLFRNHEIGCKRKLELKRLKRKDSLQKCPVCTVEFDNESSLVQHLSVNHRLMWRIQCEKCNIHLHEIGAVIQHYKNSKCQSLSKSVSATSSCTMQCLNCNKSFRRISKILQHHFCHKASLVTRSLQLPIATSQRLRRPLQSMKGAKFVCSICNKPFGSANSLSQHRITHSQEKRHKCGLCTRVFKRRGGLTQHMKGFHLQLKPYECPVCKHCYALKCDMQRCRHSLLQKRAMEYENSPEFHAEARITQNN